MNTYKNMSIYQKTALRNVIIFAAVCILSLFAGIHALNQTPTEEPFSPTTLAVAIGAFFIIPTVGATIATINNFKLQRLHREDINKRVQAFWKI